MKLTRSHSQILASILGFLVLVTPLVSSAEEAGVFQGLVYTLVITVTGWMLGIGGLILNYGINDFVLGFGKTFGDTGIGVAVNTTWTTIRDFVNMTFIFGLVYIGFKMILDSNDSQTKKWIAQLVVAALLINFSLLITKGVIEISNQFSYQIIANGFVTEDVTDSSGQKVGIEVNMSAKLMQMMGISNALGGIVSTGEIPNSVGSENAWGYIFGTGILFLVTGFVFAAGGILLIIRFAILNFYMILSPVLFLGFILPPLQGSLQKYWGQFLSKCFFAPVYLLLLYFSFQVLQGMQTSGRYSQTNMDVAGITANSGATIAEAAQSTIPFFILTCFFLIGSLVIAQKMGAEGASKALSMGRGLSNKAGSLAKRGAGASTLGVAGSLGRNTVGRAGNAAMKSDRLRNYAAKSSIGKAMYKTAKYGAGASYDARQVGGVGKALGIGVGATGGYKKKLDDSAKAHKEFAKELDTIDTKTPEGRRKVAEQKEALKTRKEKERETKQKEKERKELVKNSSNDDLDSLNLAIEGYEEKVKDAESSITAKKAQFATDNTLSVEARERLQEEIGDDEKALSAKKEDLSASTEARQVAISRKKIKDQVEAEKTKESEARSNGDYAGAMKAKANREKHQASLEQIDTNMDAEISDLEGEVAEIGKLLEDDKKLGNIAEAEVKYSRQIAYMDQMANSQKRWSNPLSAVGGGAAGATTAGLFSALIPGAAIGVAGAAGVAAASARGAQFGNSLEELQKEYGKDGTKRFAKEKRIKDLKLRREADKDLDGEVSDDKKDKDDDDKK